MPALPLPAALRDLLAKPNPAVIATVRPDGQPVSVATWYLFEGDRMLVNMDEGRKRLAYMRANPKVSLTVLDGDDWYSHVSVQGRVVELVEDPDLSDIDRIARRYTSRPYRLRNRRRYSAWIEIDYWHAWGAAASKPR